MIPTYPLPSLLSLDNRDGHNNVALREKMLILGVFWTLEAAVLRIMGLRCCRSVFQMLLDLTHTFDQEKIG